MPVTPRFLKGFNLKEVSAYISISLATCSLWHFYNE